MPTVPPLKFKVQLMCRGEFAMRLRTIGLRGAILNSDDLEPESFYRDMVIAGSPQTCVERISALRDEFGISYLNALSAFFGFLPISNLKSSLQLLAAEVRPRLQSPSL